jgi:hypothetical protein
VPGLAWTLKKKKAGAQTGALANGFLHNFYYQIFAANH